MDGLLGEVGGDYKENRLNGDEKDSPNSRFPSDGKFGWVHPAPRSPNKDGRYVYRYDEGPKDKAWMEERDRNYVFRLEREGRLDSVEPNLKTEVPALYAEVMAQRSAASLEVERKQAAEKAAVIAADRKKAAEERARKEAQEKADNEARIENYA